MTVQLQSIGQKYSVSRKNYGKQSETKTKLVKI